MIWINRLVFLAVLALVLWLSLLPQTGAPGGFGWDKANHTLGFMLFLWLSRRSWPELPAWPWHAGWVFAYGLLIELSQWLFTDDRIPSLADVVANTVGIGLFIALEPVVRQHYAKFHAS